MKDEELDLIEGSTIDTMRLVHELITYVELCEHRVEDKEQILTEGSATSNLRMIPQLLTWNFLSIEWKMKSSS
jgi:hypothetical protein